MCHWLVTLSQAGFAVSIHLANGTSFVRRGAGPNCARSPFVGDILMIQKSWYAGHGLLRYVASAGIMVVIAACGTDSGPGQLSEEANAPDQPTSKSSTSMPKDLRAAYITSVQREASESYAAIAMDGLVQFENAAQRFVATVDRNGLSVVPNEETWHLGMRTLALGCEGAMVPVTDAVPEAAGNRSDVHREGLEEWYLNGPLGVEQGFVMREAPACAGPKTITMAMDGDVVATLDDADGDGRGNAIRFVDDEGRAVALYTDLFVTDAKGKSIPAWLSVNAGELSIVVDDAGAVYPLAIDPVIGVEQAKLLASDGAANDKLGTVVALSGDTAIVGAYNSNGAQGSAYVFVRNGTTWIQQQKLTASDGAMGDWFGGSVALSGDTVLVGAYRDDFGTNTDQGSAYVFTRTNGVWTEQQKLAATDGAGDDLFGESVALSGDTALMGSQHDDDNGSDSGSAYVFVRNGTTWTQQAKLTAADGAANDYFGRSVALSGDTALVGAAFDDVGANSNQGSAYVFSRTGTVWTQQQKLNAADGAAGDDFGDSVALMADTALVGATLDDVGANINQGSVYVFFLSGTVWTEQQKLTATGGATNDFWGGSLGLSGDTALVGMYTYDVGANANQGAVCVFTRSGGIWTEQPKIIAADGAANDSFGLGVAISGDMALVGAYSDDNGANTDQGSAYMFILGKPIGDVCAAGAECLSGLCVDGVCCTTTCGGGDPTDCQACNVTGMTGTCAPRRMGAVCRGAAGSCDAVETCNGTAATCPTDVKVPAGTQCRAAAGICDVAEFCNGMANNCPTNAKIPAGTQCRAPAGLCDATENCDGVMDNCPADAKIAAGTQCRAPVGLCDAAETCDGVMSNCPADTKIAAGTECRVSAGACDVAESCNGMANDCPADAKLAAGTECRVSAGACDVAESCNGMANDCPADAKIAAGTECRASAGACDSAESCNGVMNDCPPDAMSPAGTECRAAMGPCDVAETCDGNANTCPTDAVATVTTECRPAAGACDLAEKCDGVTKACTPDLLAPVGAVCRPANGECDISELCTGISTDCPLDGNAPNGTKCTNGTCTDGLCTNGGGGAGGGGAGGGGAGGSSNSSSSSSSSGQGGQGGGLPGSSSSSSSSGEAGQGGGSPGSSSSSSSSGEAGQGGQGQPSDDPAEGGGCACRTAASTSPDNRLPFGGSALGLLGLLALGSRRRRLGRTSSMTH